MSRREPGSRRHEPASFHFDDVSLDVATLELERHGEPVEVQLKALDLLVYLIRHRNRVVERRELLDTLWPGEVVGEASLTQAVKGARRALGDDGAAQRRIKTVRGRGYRFIGPVEERRAESVEPGPPSTGLDAALPAARDGALERLSQRLAALDRSQGGLVAISGEPGIGKTTVIGRFVEQARATGTLVLRGRAAAEATRFWPWVQLLREHVRQRDEAELAAELGASAGVLAAMLPELRDRLPAIARHAVPEPLPVALVADALTQWLQRLAAKGPVLVVVEDLHLADAASLQLLRVVAAAAEDAALLVVVSHRPPAQLAKGPLEPLLASLRTGRSCSEIRIGGASKDEVRRWLERALGSEPPAALVDVAFERSDGNPFALRELVGHWAELGLLGGDAAATPRGALALERTLAPEVVRSVVAPVLDSIEGSTRAVLQRAALLARPGRVFDRALLRALSPVDGSGVLAAIEEGVAVSLLRADPSAAGRTAFTRALPREVLYAELPPSERRALHARAARELELMHLADPEFASAEVAHHYFEALPDGDVQKTVGLLLCAAERAAPGSPGLAASLLHRAAIALDAAPAPDPARRRAVMERLAALDGTAA